MKTALMNFVFMFVTAVCVLHVFLYAPIKICKLHQTLYTAVSTKVVLKKRKSVKAYSTLPIGIMGRKKLVLID